MQALVWQSPPAPALVAGAIHVWRARLDLSPTQLDWLRATLAADERVRAARYRDPAIGARFIAARGQLRAILGRYLHCPAAAVTFSYSEHGRPLIGSRAQLGFSVAHAGGLALFAVSNEPAIGVDLEQTQRQVDSVLLAQRFFTPGEQTALAQLDPAQRHHSFLRCWTRKEAYLKARGAGLTLPLDQVDTASIFAQLAATLAISDESGNIRNWWFGTPAPLAGYVAALAAPADEWQVICFSVEL